MNFQNTSMFLLLLLLSTSVFSQSISRSVISSSGYDGSAEHYQVSWTIGETVIGTFAAGDVMLTQGFHQGEILVTSIEETDPGQKMIAYPNPAHDELYIRVDNPEGLRYEIFDVNGQRIAGEQITSQTTSVNVSNLSPAIYYVKLKNDQQAKQTFKIIKR